MTIISLMLRWKNTSTMIFLSVFAVETESFIAKEPRLRNLAACLLTSARMEFGEFAGSFTKEPAGEESIFPFELQENLCSSAVGALNIEKSS